MTRDSPRLVDSGRGRRTRRLAGHEGMAGPDISAEVAFTVEELRQAAERRRGKGRNTVAGRALWKPHPDRRMGSPFPEPSGDALVVNQLAQSIVEEILSTPGTKIYMYRGRFIHAWPPPPDRRGVRWNLDGTFNTFIERRNVPTSGAPRCSSETTDMDGHDEDVGQGSRHGTRNREG